MIPLAAVNKLSVRFFEKKDFVCTPETVFSGLMNAWMHCTYGNTEPVLVRMGKAFSQYAFTRSRLDTDDQVYKPISFRSALVMVDETLDSFTAQLFLWDKASFPDPILFVAATIVIADETI